MRIGEVSGAWGISERMIRHYDKVGLMPAAPRRESGYRDYAMPAWGRTHNDQLIWDMVAFLRQLPRMNAEHYQAAVASAPESNEEMMEHMGGAKHGTRLATMHNSCLNRHVDGY